MKTSSMLAPLLLTAAIAVPALADKPEAPAATAVTDKDSAKPAIKEKMVCRSEKVTGSRTKVNRTCMTQAEWDALAEQTRKNLSDYERSTSRAPTSKNQLGGN